MRRPHRPRRRPAGDGGDDGGTRIRTGVAAFARDHALHGDDAYAGPFDRYRDIERDQGLTASFQGRGIDVPVPYMTGDKGHDPGCEWSPRAGRGPARDRAEAARRHGPARP